MSSLHVSSDTSSSHVGADDCLTGNETKCSIGMGVGNSMFHIGMKGDSTEQPRNVRAETNNCTDNSSEPLRLDEIPLRVCSSIEEKDYSMSKLENHDIDPNNLPDSKSCSNLITLQTPDQTVSPSKHIQPINVKERDLIAIIAKESVKVTTNSENECQLVDDGNQIDVKEEPIEVCESLKYFNTELRNSSQPSGFEENEVSHNDLSLMNSMSTKGNKDSKSVIIMEQQVMNETSNEYGTSSDGQQKSIHCKSDKSYILENSSSDSSIYREKENLEKKNDIETNVLSNIVKNECDYSYKFDDNYVKSKKGKIKSASECLHSKFTKPSVGESRVTNISDSIVNVSTGTVNELSQDTVSLALKEKKAELDSVGLVKRPCKSEVQSPTKTPLFRRGSFPRIALRDTGGMPTIKRVQRRLLKERERREILVHGCVSKKRPVKENIPKKNKNIPIRKTIESYPSEKAISKETKIKYSTNDLKLKNLKVSLKRIDVKLLSKYNVDLRNLHVSAAVNKISNENIQSLKASNFSKNKIKNVGLSTHTLLQKDKTIGIEENMGLPRKGVGKKIPMNKQSQFKSYGAVLKNVSVRVLKIDDNTLLKYGYRSQKLKASNAAIITHQKTRGENNLNKKKNNHILKLNNMQDPAKILSKIDVTYPNVLKQTLKVNTNEKNKNSKNSIRVRRKMKVSPKNSKSDSRNYLKTVQISVPKIDYEAFSKYGIIVNTYCNGRKIRPQVDAKDSGTVKSADVQPLDMHSQEKLSTKRKADSFNDVKIGSKENLCMNEVSWNLKHARVRVMKLDNSVLPKIISPVIIK